MVYVETLCLRLYYNTVSHNVIHFNVYLHCESGKMVNRRSYNQFLKQSVRHKTYFFADLFTILNSCICFQAPGILLLFCYLFIQV